jgi:hypothetical protein
MVAGFSFSKMRSLPACPIGSSRIYEAYSFMDLPPRPGIILSWASFKETVSNSGIVPPVLSNEYHVHIIIEVCYLPVVSVVSLSPPEFSHNEKAWLSKKTRALISKQAGE